MADKVRSALDLAEVPFPVQEAIQRLGGEIETVPLDEGEALVQKRGDSFVIQVAEQ